MSKVNWKNHPVVKLSLKGELQGLLSTHHKETMVHMCNLKKVVDVFHFDCDTEEELLRTNKEWLIAHFGSEKIPVWEESPIVQVGLLVDVSALLFKGLVETELKEEGIKEHLDNSKMFMAKLLGIRDTVGVGSHQVNVIYDKLETAYIEDRSVMSNAFMDDKQYRRAVVFLVQWYLSHVCFEDFIKNNGKLEEDGQLGDSQFYQIYRTPFDFHKPIKINDLIKMAYTYRLGDEMEMISLMDSGIETLEDAKSRKAFCDKAFAIEMNAWIDELWDISRGRRIEHLERLSIEREADEAVMREREEARQRRNQMRQERREREQAEREAKAKADAELIAQRRAERLEAQQTVVEEWIGWDYKEKFRFIKKLFGF